MNVIDKRELEPVITAAKALWEALFALACRLFDRAAFAACTWLDVQGLPVDKLQSLRTRK